MRWSVLAGLLLLALLAACRTSGGDVYLDEGVGKRYRAIMGHTAVTVSERTAIYGTPDPGPVLVCHEEAHKRQARIIADALVGIGALEDEELPRMAAWVAVYGIDYAVHGYAGNRFERGARRACGQED